MSFGGGSDGSTGITDHLHTNSVGEGGSLDSTSLINNAGIFSLMVALG